MIPEYPAFAPLSLGHKDVVRAITAQYDPYSDFNFTSLFGWNVDGTTEVSLLHDNLVVRFPHYQTGELAVSVLGSSNIDATLEELLAVTQRIEFVPEIVIKNIQDTSRFKIQEDPGNHDYIYDASLVASMPGNAYKKKRNKKNHIIEAYGNQLQVDVCTEFNNISEVEDAFNRWVQENDRDCEDCRAEFIALQRTMQHLKELSLLIIVVRIEGKICGFSVNEILGNGYALCHYEKTMSAHKDMASYLAHVVSGELLKRDCRLLDWEQDLDIEGLRQAKMSWQPIAFLKKYTITDAMLYSK